MARLLPCSNIVLERLEHNPRGSHAQEAPPLQRVRVRCHRHRKCATKRRGYWAEGTSVSGSEREQAPCISVEGHAGGRTHLLFDFREAPAAL